MPGAPSRHELTTNKAETARRYMSAREVEQESKAHAQKLADETAAELEDLAQSMADITNTMSGVLMQVAQAAKSAGDTTRTTAKHLETTSVEMRETAREWTQVAKNLKLSLQSQYQRVLVIAALSAAIGSASATLLHHYLPDSQPSSPSQPTVTIDTDALAIEIINRWRQYQTGSAR